ncbi:MAG: hypothetical protein F4X65_05785 [Chloroflexi bacterium]|nr:hypothetical protein [Chloroflexota bacterium]
MGSMSPSPSAGKEGFFPDALESAGEASEAEVAGRVSGRGSELVAGWSAGRVAGCISAWVAGWTTGAAGTSGTGGTGVAVEEAALQPAAAIIEESASPANSSA